MHQSIVGSVNSTAHVDAVGYKLSLLKFRVTDAYPRGGIVSDPVKNDRMFSRVTQSLVVLRSDSNSHRSRYSIKYIKAASSFILSLFPFSEKCTVEKSFRMYPA